MTSWYVVRQYISIIIYTSIFSTYLIFESEITSPKLLEFLPKTLTIKEILEEATISERRTPRCSGQRETLRLE
jgi:hypothetical protein